LSCLRQTQRSKTIVDQDGRPDDEEKCNNSRKNSVEIKKCVSILAAASSKKNADSPHYHSSLVVVFFAIWNTSVPSLPVKAFIGFGSKNGWSIRIDNDLRLWTWGRYKKLMKVYDGQPLWTEEDTRVFQQQQQQQQ
jgi:hypothetical protein